MHLKKNIHSEEGKNFSSFVVIDNRTDDHTQWGYSMSVNEITDKPYTQNVTLVGWKITCKVIE